MKIKGLFTGIIAFVLVAGFTSSAFADQAAGWPVECGQQAPPTGGDPHGPLTATPIGNSVSLNTVATASFPNPAVVFVLDPGVGSSIQTVFNVGMGSPVGVQFNNLSPGPHTAVVCYNTVVGTGHTDSVAFNILDNGIVGGELLSIDSTTLLLAGLQSSAIWMLPVLAGAAGTAAFYLKTRKN